ncbi:putative membrane protein [Propionispora sp. 2/2-37]|uniref:ABC transporter substrate-binding protein n=1 Tax=Propionispora sp. 2/2-37 TaxID=1677858 RepID=UPI0006BB560F|nr:ABC transporter substrate-binding protein [Propionispora sp. 2/2-37]CUH97064.1 putative membrane protein [Propionispora sp. 2/2-37]
MADKKTVKNIILGLVGIAVIGGIAYGANFAEKPVSGGSEVKSAQTTGQDDGLIPIRTWSKTDCSSTPWVVADLKGFFAEEGLKIVYTGDTQPAQQIPSILNGNNDVGSEHPNKLAVAIAGGAKIKGVVRAGIDPTPDLDPKLRHMNWYVNPEKFGDVHSFKDLANKEGQLTFSTITKNICADFLANQIADRQGLSRDKIEWVSMPDVQAVQALKQGLIAVAGVHPPYYKSMEDAGMVKIADSLDAGLGVAGGVGYYYFTTDFIDKNPEIIKKFARAIAKAQKWSNDYPEEARKMTEDWIHVPINATHYYATDTKIIESEIVPWIEDLEKSKVISQGKVKPSDLVIHSFDS